MNEIPCARCGTLTAPSALAISLDGNGMICSACAIAARAVQEKKGMRKAYITGAGIVGAVVLYFALRFWILSLHG